MINFEVFFEGYQGKAKSKAKAEPKPDEKSNTINAIVDMASELAQVFKKYSRPTRKKAWEKLISEKGKKEMSKIIANPNRSLNGIRTLWNAKK